MQLSAFKYCLIIRDKFEDMNKNYFGVWLDGKEAFILKSTEAGRSVKHIHSDIETHERIKGEGKAFTRMGNLYIDPEKSQENRREHQAERFFEKIAKELEDAGDFIVFGPAQIKLAFSKWIGGQSGVKHKLLDTLTADKMSENQMFAFIFDYYQKK